jgi:hypothetical protein
MRTDEQRQAFAKECWEIEKQGGDVLEYIRVNWPSYTPGATWFNLQRVYLPDKKMTSGKPKKEGGEEEMRRDRIETLNGILNALKNGEHPYDYLESVGYMNPHQAYVDTRNWARKYDHDAFEQLPVSLKKLQVKPKSAPINFKDEPVPDLRAGEALPLKLPKKPVENRVEDDKAPETVVFGGKEYEKYEKPETVVEMTDKHGNKKRVKLYGASPTCCQPALPSGVTVPDELPEEKPKANEKPLPVCAVKSRVKGEWHLSAVAGCVHLIWEDKITHEERSLGLTADDWQKLAKEIPVMLMQLGLSN